jgi:hypothetical protein
MDEYIKRADAIKARGRSCDRKCAECDFAIDGDSWCEGEVFVVDLLRIPEADVRPVVRGEWTRIDYVPHGHDYKCSACGWKNDMPTHFCPNCGADMREES